MEFCVLFFEIFCVKTGEQINRQKGRKHNFLAEMIIKVNTICFFLQFQLLLPNLQLNLPKVILIQQLVTHLKFPQTNLGQQLIQLMLHPVLLQQLALHLKLSKVILQQQLVVHLKSPKVIPQVQQLPILQHKPVLIPLQFRSEQILLCLALP